MRNKRMRTRQCTEERFMQDVAHHEMQIIRDDDEFRHLRFGKPGTSDMHFNITTWPGYLCYSGDMGTFVFWRLNDMFEFFRTANRAGSDELQINPQYWSEKLEAVDNRMSHPGFKEYDSERFEKIVKEQLVEWWREGELDRDGRRALREAIENEVLSAADNSEVRAYDAAVNFRFECDSVTYEFTDFWERDFQRYTFRFLWCCYAIAWGVKQYDAAMAASSVDAA